MKNQKITDVCKNAAGTVVLLVSGLLMWTVFSDIKAYADPIAPSQTAQTRLAPGRTAARTSASRATSASRSTTASRATSASRSVGTTNRGVSARGISTRATNASGKSVSPVRINTNRTVGSRRVEANNTTMRGTASRNSKRVVARTAANQSRVSLLGSGMRASSGSLNISALTNKLYTGNYSNIIDSQTGLISADAYSNCLESYYTCMDEICTARSDTKGRCSCAGRATNFLDAESALEKANEELIQLSGQLALLVATNGKDVSEAFKLTDAEKVMNCVSYKDARAVAGTTKDSKGNTINASTYMKNWCQSHMLYDTNACSDSVMPSYCSSNDFGFDISNIDGSSSDILASLKAWADAKDLAKQYTDPDTNNLISSYTNLSGIVNGLSGITSTTVEEAELDGLANTWGYELFQYAHNNVCGRVLDSCFNGIYEGCGIPPTVRVNNSTGGTATATLCANNATSNCPFNYNSKVEIDSAGEVKLNERGTGSATTTSSAACFGYSTSTTTSGTTTTTDPYASLRGPVADARRSIMQKYLLDANAACDTYGVALKNTAQNINYQKIAAEQALRQKRLEFYNEEQSKILNDAIVASSNFDECLSELLDCYENQADATTSSGAKWTWARIKTYCAQVANVPHCYEDMICNPSTAQFKAIIDVQDSQNCLNSQDPSKNTCRNIVTLNEILNGTGATAMSVAAGGTGSSAAMRAQCLADAGVEELRMWSPYNTESNNVACSIAEIRATDTNAAAGYKASADATTCYITACNTGYYLLNGVCEVAITDCASEIPGARTAYRSVETGGACVLESCSSGYHQIGDECISNTRTCNPLPDGAASATQTWTNNTWGACQISSCRSGYTKSGNECRENND